MRDYMGNTDIVYAQDCRIEAEDAKTYCRRSVPWGYVRATLRSSTDITGSQGAIYLAVAISVIPILLVFAFFSKYIISSIAAGAVKE